MAPAAALAVMMVLKAIILRSIVWLVIMGWGAMASAVLLAVVPIYDVCAATMLFDFEALKVKEAATIVSVAASLM